jgi:hypothetical protein
MTVTRRRIFATLGMAALVGAAAFAGGYAHPGATMINYDPNYHVTQASGGPISESVTALKPIPGQATLPVSSQDPLIKNLKVGQIDYTVPWAMWEDTHRRAWLNPNYDITTDVEGTSHMEIRRDAGGFHVWITSGDSEEIYTPEASPSYVGENGPWIPVRYLTVN